MSLRKKYKYDKLSAWLHDKRLYHNIHFVHIIKNEKIKDLRILIINLN